MALGVCLHWFYSLMSYSFLDPLNLATICLLEMGFTTAKAPQLSLWGTISPGLRSFGTTNFVLFRDEYTFGGGYCFIDSESFNPEKYKQCGMIRLYAMGGQMNPNYGWTQTRDALLI